MADKPLTVRISEEKMKVLEKRVEVINNLTPEASVTVSSVVRYIINEYVEKLERKDIQQELIFPYANELDEYRKRSLVEARVVDSEENLIAYNDEELKQIKAGLYSILNVLENKSNVPIKVLTPWQELEDKLSRYYDKLRLAYYESENLEEIVEEIDEPGIEYGYECPNCCGTFTSEFTEEPTTVTCWDCKETFEAYDSSGSYGNRLTLVKDWNEENEKWQFGHRPNGLNREDEKAQIDNFEYEAMSIKEKENYRECDVCGNVYEKYTGVCRLDEESGIYQCKECRR